MMRVGISCEWRTVKPTLRGGFTYALTGFALVAYEYLAALCYVPAAGFESRQLDIYIFNEEGITPT